jgi:DNA-binding LacI/PurR family transcriptional regulator
MTNREIAAKLNVSPATLSLVINNKPGISAATRERVLRGIEAQGFSHLLKKVKENGKPSVPASEEKNICFVVYKRDGKILDTHSFFLLLIESIESYAHRFGYNTLFLSIDRRNPMEPQIQRLNALDCVGAIIFATEMYDDDISFFSTVNLPYVLLDNDFPHMNVDSVAINNTLGTYQAVEYLVRMGHSHIGYLQSSNPINSFAERERGFHDAMSSFCLTLNPNYIFKVSYTEDGAYQDFRKYLSLDPVLPTAFFSDDDTIVAGVMKALAEVGISVPHDISLIGFNDRPAYAKSSPAFTTILVPKYAFGAMAVDLLLKRIEVSDLSREGSPSYKYRIGTELVIRDSVIPPVQS